MRTLRTILIFWVPLIAWLLVIHNFSATPAQDLPRISIPHADKVFHAVEYFVLGVLLIRAFDHSARLMIDAERSRGIDKSDFKLNLAKLTVLAIIIALCYGALDELYQRAVPGRMCDLFDFITDCAGALVGIFLYISDREERRG